MGGDFPRHSSWGPFTENTRFGVYIPFGKMRSRKPYRAIKKEMISGDLAQQLQLHSDDFPGHFH